MAKQERLVRYTAEELAAMVARGESRTDWARVNAMSPEEVERLADEEDGPLPEGWEKTVINGLPPGIMGLPPGKDAVKLRIDRDVLSWFCESGRGYQTRMNNVLRAFMEARRAPGR